MVKDREVCINRLVYKIGMDSWSYLYPKRHKYRVLLDFVKSDTYKSLCNYKTELWKQESDYILELYSKEKGLIVPYFNDENIFKYLGVKEKSLFELLFIVVYIMGKQGVNLGLICKYNLVDHLQKNLEEYNKISILEIIRSIESYLMSQNYVIGLSSVEILDTFKNEPNYTGKVRKYDVFKMKMWRFEYILNHLSEELGDLTKALVTLVTSETYIHFLDTSSDFWWKSNEELCYLIDKELEGDMGAWWFQAY